MTHLLLVAISAVLVNNFVLTRFLGTCPFLGVSKRIETAMGMGMAVVFVMAVSGAATWSLNKAVLEPFELEYLQTMVFILVIAALVQFVELVLQKLSPVLYQALGIYLPLITTNCAILGLAVLNVKRNLDFLEMLVFGTAGGVGFALALVLMAGLREKMETADIPEVMKGTAIALLTAGLLSLAFMGFAGLVKE